MVPPPHRHAVAQVRQLSKMCIRDRYYPPVFLFVARDSAVQKWLSYLSRGWIAAYLALGAVLLVIEPGNVRIRYIRTSTVLRCVMLLSVAALYALLSLIHISASPRQFVRRERLFE